VLFAYLQRVTGQSRQHLSRLLDQYRGSKSLRLRKRIISRSSFPAKYGLADSRLKRRAGKTVVRTCTTQCASRATRARSSP